MKDSEVVALAVRQLTGKRYAVLDRDRAGACVAAYMKPKPAALRMLKLNVAAGRPRYVVVPPIDIQLVDGDRVLAVHRGQDITPDQLTALEDHIAEEGK